MVQTNDFYGAWPIYRDLVNQNRVPIRVCLTVPYDEMASVKVHILCVYEMYLSLMT
jgi:hypothetical protein